MLARTATTNVSLLLVLLLELAAGNCASSTSCTAAANSGAQRVLNALELGLLALAPVREYMHTLPSALWCL